ncbi:hypothetical protein FRC01_008480 [Tulasnella sp. 417]|nr:hypothetical protein FRC01_008480 [Tulasnella sp. 417]
MAQDSSLSRGRFLLAASLLSRVPELKKQPEEEHEVGYTERKWVTHVEAMARVNEAHKAKALLLLVGKRNDSVFKKEKKSMEPEEPQAGPSTSTSTSTTSSSDISNRYSSAQSATNYYGTQPSWSILAVRPKSIGPLGQCIEDMDDTVFEDELEDACFLFAMTTFGYTYEYRKRRNRSNEPFNVDNLALDGRWEQMVRMALRDLGLSENATVQEVEAEGAQFTSLMCDGGAERNEGLSFLEIIDHNCSRHDTPVDDTQTVIKRDPPSDEANVSSGAS